ncbi:SNF2 family N-terminal domain protein [Aeromicrobium marinum DSM 15272]|uniref:SNF2 family N-terminal domain protein n=1 Tax=Aeromicrobium marinum DSM 15272 TaxID=585531 RepID=E2SAG8_9ACTN|nr:DEAD/DEAH box helicase [Aeromicrobium marinum]EFQ84242.1 SNF2 family N-terminal domain protein [Aeromicrobium marinum DSM 15272]
MPTRTDLRALLRHRVEFREAESPGDSRFVFHSPDGPHEASAQDAVGALSHGIRAMSADPSARAWATPAILALRLMATGRLGAPGGSDLDQLRAAGAAIGPDAATGQRHVFAFLKALAVDAPAVALTPQGDEPGIRPRRTETEFGFTLVVTFLDEPTDAESGVVRLRIRPRAAAAAPFDAADLFAGPERPIVVDARTPTLAMLERLGQRWAPAARLADPHSRGATTVSTDELSALGDPALTTNLMANRVEIRWPAELVRDLDTRGVVGLEPGPDDEHPADRTWSGHDRPAAFTSGQLFRFDWQVALGDDVLSEAELDLLASEHRGLLRLRDRWVMVDRARIRRALDQRHRGVSQAEALRAAITGRLEIDGELTDVDTVGWLDDVRRRLAVADRDLLPDRQPADLQGTLRDYQLQGLRWMSQLVGLGLGGCLADDMGLGKTVMLIALHLQRVTVTPAPTLVVCPASVLGNWEREIARFAPGEPVRRFHGPTRSLDGLTHGFVITTYATMRSSAADLAEQRWGLLVADEAQNVKNPRSRAAQALRSIDAAARLALTGTPVENNLGELWAILDWTTPGLLGGPEEFRHQWSRPIESGRDPQLAAELSGLIRPFVLRRRKSDPGIAPELPPKFETDHRANLTREQVGLYEATVRATMAQIESASGIHRRGLIIKLLTQLKQICNHPGQFLRETEGRLTGRSGKLLLLDDLLPEIVAEDGAALVFTQYARMGHLLSRHLADRGIDHFYLHGGTPIPRRERMVQQFSAGEAPVFVLSLKAAGTGLNLTRADHVIHYDRWWNPAVEDQATDRAHRIGQTKSVQVHRLMSEGTIEESIAELIASKRALADAVVNAGEMALTELSDTDLARLVRLRA